jgi:hypothetical protein
MRQRLAEAYSFQALIKQNTAVTAMPVRACGTMMLRNAAQRE